MASESIPADQVNRHLAALAAGRQRRFTTSDFAPQPTWTNSGVAPRFGANTGGPGIDPTRGIYTVPLAGVSANTNPPRQAVLVPNLKGRAEGRAWDRLTLLQNRVDARDEQDALARVFKTCKTVLPGTFNAIYRATAALPASSFPALIGLIDSWVGAEPSHAQVEDQLRLIWTSRNRRHRVAIERFREAFIGGLHRGNAARLLSQICLVAARHHVRRPPRRPIRLVNAVLHSIAEAAEHLARRGPPSSCETQLCRLDLPGGIATA